MSAVRFRLWALCMRVWYNGRTSAFQAEDVGSIPITRLAISLVLREWLSARASPCQGEGRGFESRLALSRSGFIEYDGVTFFVLIVLSINCNDFLIKNRLIFDIIRGTIILSKCVTYDVCGTYGVCQRKERVKMNKNMSKAAAIALALNMGLCSVSAIGAEGRYSKYFTDVNEDNYGWAIDAVDYLCEHKVVNGVGDNKYAPANKIERGDFAVMLDNQFNIPEILTYMVSYNDVDEEDYYYKAIVNLRGNNIVTNIGMFYPEVYITRLDAMTMLYKAMDVCGYVKSNGSTDLSMYSDANEVSNVNAKIAIGTLTKMGIVSGSDGKIMPNSNMSRAEMAVLMYNAKLYMESVDAQSESTVDKPVKEPEKAESDKIDGQTLTEAISAEAQEDFAVNNTSINIDLKEVGKSAIALSETKGKINKVVIEARGEELHGINLAKYSTLESAELDIRVLGPNADCIYVDATSSVVVNSSKMLISSVTGAAIVNCGNMTIDNTEITADKTAAIKLYGESNTSIKGSTISGAGDGPISIYAKSNKDKDDVVTLNLSDTAIIGDGVPAFYINDVNTVINMNGGVTIGDKVTRLLKTNYNYQRQITSGSDVVMNLNNQTIKGEIELDNMSTLELNLKNGSLFNGVINNNKSAQSVAVILDEDSTLELTGTSYIDVLVDEDLTFQNIQDHGNSIYYNADDPRNFYLGEGSYSLPNGGTLAPRD